MNQVTLFRDNQTGLDFAADLGEVTPVSWQPPAELGGVVLRLAAKRRVERAQNGTYTVSEILGSGRRTAYENDTLRWFGYCTYVIRQDERIIYVGMSNYGPQMRLKRHKYSGKPAIREALAQLETVIDVTFYGTHADAAKAERLLIDRLAPEVNER